MKIEATFTPAEFALLSQRNLSETACVVFDILRATSTIVTALARGAESVLPVASIEEAVCCRAADADVLLAGERNGLRITAAVSGGVEFDLGNSPHEFTSAKVRGRRIVMTTTNGTRAFAACHGAKHLFAGSFLNWRRTTEQVARCRCENVILVCSGTGEAAAFEDCLGAGATCRGLLELAPTAQLSDAARIALNLFAAHADDLERALEQSSNARRLRSIPELRDDVAFCVTENLFPIVATANAAGRIGRGAE